jgi:DNA polymerase-3 subunit alpha
MEKELLGVYLSGHPLEAVDAKLRVVVSASCREVNEAAKLGEVILGGSIASLRRKVTKAGKMMAFVTLEDLSGVAEMVIWSDTYERCVGVLADGAIVVVRGMAEVDDRWRDEREGGNQTKVIVDMMASLNDEPAVRNLRFNGTPRSGRGQRNGRNGQANGAARQTAKPANGKQPAAAPAKAPAKEPEKPAPPSERVHIRLPLENAGDAMGQLRDLISQCYGDTEVLLHIQMGEQEHRVRLGPDFLVKRDEQFTEAVRNLLGDGAVWLE